jgi:hypothetical protein
MNNSRVSRCGMNLKRKIIDMDDTVPQFISAFEHRRFFSGDDSPIGSEFANVSYIRKRLSLEEPVLLGGADFGFNGLGCEHCPERVLNGTHGIMLVMMHKTNRRQAIAGRTGVGQKLCNSMAQPV